MKLEVIKTEEGTNVRDITFSKYPGEKDIALERTIEALNDLGNMDLVSLPGKYMYDLVQLLISICKEDPWKRN